MEKFQEGIDFFNALWNAPVPFVALENSKPHGLAMAQIGRPTQTVQPWMFGEGFTKGASLWLKNLPPLIPHTTKADFKEIVPMCHMMPPGPDREKARSKTYKGIAQAMATQWSAFVVKELTKCAAA